MGETDPDDFDEKFVGEKLLQYAGMVVLALGVVFFLVWPGIRQTGTKRGSVGQPVPGVVMKGYLGDEAKTREVLRDGWYVTGDIARVDEDGFVTLTDRLSRFSKIGGEMVPHIKVEARRLEGPA